jgi:hypothetical protein
MAVAGAWIGGCIFTSAWFVFCFRESMYYDRD